MKIKTVFPIVVLPILMGCAVGDKVTIQRIEDTQTFAISTTAGDNVVLQSETPNGSRLCTVHSPTVGESFNEGFSLFGDSAQAGDSVIELTGRSPVLSVQQDTFSALCAMYLSGALSNDEYVRLMTRYMDKYAEALADQVKQTSITVSQGNGPDEPPTIILPNSGASGGVMPMPTNPYAVYPPGAVPPPQ
jgi:hypothetical protein